MRTGAKVAIGCGCLLLLGTGAVVGVVGVGTWWAAGKLPGAESGLDRIVSRARELERWTREANAHPYTPPAGGVIPEGRFLTFLETRKRVHALYERYEPLLRTRRPPAESDGHEVSPPDLLSAGGKLAEAASEIRLAQMKALAELGMCEQEYRDIQVAVYKTAWASAVEAKSGRMPSEAVSESVAGAAKGMDEAMRAGLETARREGVPGSGRVSDDDVRKLREQVTELGRQAGEALEVPKANVELFRKHEADIRKYAMHGLAYVGL
jgi:hypothetical protein